MIIPESKKDKGIVKVISQILLGSSYVITMMEKKYSQSGDILESATRLVVIKVFLYKVFKNILA